MSARPDVPAELRRRVLVEAGHRCAIPTCRQIPVDVHHIREWSKVKRHDFDNLIALCPTCHRRCKDKDIDGLAVRQYKLNLGLLNSRYSEFERRILELYGRRVVDGTHTALITLPKHGDLFVLHLVQDGLLTDVGAFEYDHHIELRLTPHGLDYVRKLVGAEPVDIEAEPVAIELDEPQYPDDDFEDRLAGERQAVIDLCRWFFSRYEDPAQGVPYDGGEGSYQYTCGGPYDAEEVLRDAFGDTVSDADFDRATKIIANYSTDWVEIGLY